MINVISKLICFTIMTFTGLYVTRKILDNKERILTLKNIVLLFVLIIMPFILYDIQYTAIYTIITYLLSIIIYKCIFKESFVKTTIATSLFFATVFLGDIICSSILAIFITIDQLRSIWYIQLLTNISINLIVIAMFNNKTIQNKCIGIVNSDKIRPKEKIIFLVLMVIVISCLFYSVSVTYNWDSNFVVDIIVLITFLIMVVIFIEENNNYKNLNDSYDSLFQYIQNFENLIEKEQLNRHEYKNQLAVLRCMTKEKKLKAKIDEIIADNINIDSEQVNQLKALPSGGVKGLMYYKLAVAQNNKINIFVDVTIDNKSLLNTLSEDKIRTLCKLIGIYFDNAIEAARETRTKKVLIEVYESNGNIKFVFSNTFNKNKKLANHNQKGVSTKSKGRGNGLYFASQMLSKNKWLEEQQEVIDNYYIETITVIKENKKIK